MNCLQLKRYILLHLKVLFDQLTLYQIHMNFKDLFINIYLTRCCHSGLTRSTVLRALKWFWRRDTTVKTVKTYFLTYLKMLERTWRFCAQIFSVAYLDAHEYTLYRIHIPYDYVILNPVYTIQLVVKPVVQPVWLVQPVWQPALSCKQTSNRLSNRLSNGFDNRFDNRVERTAVRSTGCQTGLYNRLTTGLTTGCIVYTNIYPVVKPVWQPVWQQVVSCKRGFRVSRRNEAVECWRYS